MAQRVDLIIDQGSKFTKSFDTTGTDLTGLSARMQIRTVAGDPALLLDAGSYLTVDIANNKVNLVIPGSATDTATWTYAVYDVEVYKVGDTSVSPIRVAQGDVRLDRQVTT